MSSIPKIDLHRHLDGNIRIPTILELADWYGLKLPATTEETLRPFVTVTEPQPGLVAFLDKFKWSTSILADEAACRRIAFENVEDAMRERLAYVELRFSPYFMAQVHGLDVRAVIDAVVDGVRGGSELFGVKVHLIGILSRTFGVETCEQELAAILDRRDHFVALDLAGNEADFPARDFEPHFRKAREAGLAVTVHAGEAAGPESVWEAVDILQAKRIGHGVRAIEDPRLIEQLRENRIGLECCLTSNVQTSTVDSYAAHPFKQFLREGLLATLNTDDPGISGITFDYELEIAAPQAGLSEAEIQQARRNAWEIAYLSEDERREFLGDECGEIYRPCG